MSDIKVYTGVVIFFSGKKGYGFIKWENQKDLFFHFSDIIMNGYKTLEKEDKVTFKLGENRHGVIKAIEIEKLMVK
jgi:CspA family cold shock protein